MHERLHKALQGTNQTWHLKRSREQYVKSTNSFTEYYRFERNLSCPAWFVSNISPELTFKFLNCYFFYVEGRICPTPFLRKVPQRSRICYFVQERLCSELREEKVSFAPCLPWVVDVERGKRLIDVLSIMFFVASPFWFVVFFEHIVKLVPKKFGEGCFWMKRMVRVEYLELRNTCLVTSNPKWGILEVAIPN